MLLVFIFWFIDFRHSLLTSCYDRCFQSLLSLLTFLARRSLTWHLSGVLRTRLATLLAAAPVSICSPAPSLLAQLMAFICLHLSEHRQSP